MSDYLREYLREYLRYAPVNPEGLVLRELSATGEAVAWTKLLRAYKHLPYKGISAFRQEEYTVVNLKDCNEYRTT